ncbi:MAG: hypothetical protein KGM42_08965 [Hyphomicrobiales bacterium]|nr:hypothetical protein [Hyphomicrobiales bacterium]
MDARAADAAADVAARSLDIWLARLAVLAIVALQLLLVNDLSPFPRWLLPALELAMLAPLSIATAWSLGKTRGVADAEDPSDRWATVVGHRKAIRTAFLAMTAFVSAANLISLNGLVFAILGGHAANGKSLLLDSLNIWGTNLLVFALWYWHIDRKVAGLDEEVAPDFVFTQQTLPPELTRRAYNPGFVDYLFLAFTNATAFSPSDTFPLTARAKLLMMLQALISLVTIALVAARAVGILA